MAEETPADRSGRPDPLSVLWHALVTPQALLVLLGLLALTFVTANLVPQIPLAARSNPPQWLAAQPYLAGSAWIRSLRLYDLTHSLWLRLLLALLGAVLLTRLARAMGVAWCAGRPGRWTAAHARLKTRGAGREQVLPLPPAGAVAESQQDLARHGFCSSTVADGSVTLHAASRRPWALWAAPCTYAGFLVGLTGVLILIALGWQSEQWQPRLGESRSVGTEGDTIVRTEGFLLERDDSGRVVAARTQISWHGGERELGSSFAAAGHPAKLNGLAVRQVGYVPVLSIRGWDEEGRPLLLQEEADPGLPTDVEVVFPSAEARPVLFLEKQDRLLVLGFDAGSHGDRPALSLTLSTSTGTEQTPLGTLYESGSVSFEGSRLQVDMAFRPVLQADYLPGAALAVGGSMLALVALALLWLAQPKLAWLSAASDTTTGARVWAASLDLEGRGGSSRPNPQGDGLRARVPGVLRSAIRVSFVVWGAGLTAGVAWAWRTTGQLADHAVAVGWPLVGMLLCAMSLLFLRMPRHGPRWAAILAALSAAAVLAGFLA